MRLTDRMSRGTGKGTGRGGSLRREEIDSARLLGSAGEPLSGDQQPSCRFRHADARLQPLRVTALYSANVRLASPPSVEPASRPRRRWLRSCTRPPGTGRPPGQGGILMKRESLTNLLYEALETEQGGIKLYETALLAAVNKELRTEWEEYLEQTKNHEAVLRQVFEQMKLDPGKETPGRLVVRRIGERPRRGHRDGARRRGSGCGGGGGRGGDRPRGDQGPLELGAPRRGGQGASGALRARPSARRTKRSKTRRTSTSTTRPAGAASCT